MANNTDDAEKRKKKLEVLRAKRIEQGATNAGEDDAKGGVRGRLKKAFAKRKQATGDAGELKARGSMEMSGSEADAAPRKKAAMKKRIMKKLAMKKRAMKKRGGGANAAKVDASSSLEAISKRRQFVEARISKLKESLAEKTSELEEIAKLEASKSK